MDRPDAGASPQRDATLDAIVSWLIETAERAPVLMAWEDLHWADPTTLETLGMLIEQTPTAALLVVARAERELFANGAWSSPVRDQGLRRPRYGPNLCAGLGALSAAR